MLEKEIKQSGPKVGMSNKMLKQSIKQSAKQNRMGQVNRVIRDKLEYNDKTE